MMILDPYTDLQTFKDWWWEKRPFSVPGENILSHVADTHGIVLFRDGQYQVELFNVKPNSEIPSHNHPNVDSFEVFVGGDITFTCDDNTFTNLKLGDSIRILPSSQHGGKFGKRGGCFISVQAWLNNINPKFVGDDWGDQCGYNSYSESMKSKHVNINT